jgi:hypothetical protein
MPPEAAPLFRAHLAPLPAQLLAALEGHLPEPSELLTNPLLLFGRHGFEFLPALTKQLSLLRRHGSPLLEAFLGTGALLRRHGDPPLTSPRERLLPFGGQAVPFALEVLQELLLRRRERLPGARRRRRGGAWFGRRRLLTRRGLGEAHVDRRHGQRAQQENPKQCAGHCFGLCGGGAGF